MSFITDWNDALQRDTGLATIARPFTSGSRLQPDVPKADAEAYAAQGGLKPQPTQQPAAPSTQSVATQTPNPIAPSHPGLKPYKRGDTITTDNVGNAPVNSYNGVANNESMAKANAIRQQMIDAQPRGGSASLPDQNAAWNARMDRARQMDDVATLMARNPQVAQGIASAFNAQQASAAEGVRGQTMRDVENTRGQNQLAAEGLRGKNQLLSEASRGKNQLEVAGLQGQAQLAAEGQRGINAQTLEQLRQSSPELATIMARNLAEAGMNQKKTELMSAKPTMDPTKIFESMVANGGDPSSAFTMAQAAAQGVNLEALMNKFQSQQAVKRAQGGIIPDPDHLAAQESVQQGRGLDVSGRMVTGAGTSKSDSLPAVIDGEHPAELSKNEFVLPEEVVRYFGLNHLNRMIEKARKGLASAPT